jgi:hypothetical protein
MMSLVSTGTLWKAGAAHIWYSYHPEFGDRIYMAGSGVHVRNFLYGQFDVIVGHTVPVG